MCSLTRFFGVCRKDTDKHGARGHGGWHNIPRWRHILGLVSCLFVFDVRCCSMLQRVTAQTVYCSCCSCLCCLLFLCRYAFASVLSPCVIVAVRCGALQYVVGRCSTLQYVVACWCNLLQCIRHTATTTAHSAAFRSSILQPNVYFHSNVHLRLE